MKNNRPGVLLTAALRDRFREHLWRQKMKNSGNEAHLPRLRLWYRLLPSLRVQLLDSTLLLLREQLLDRGDL